MYPCAQLNTTPLRHIEGVEFSTSTLDGVEWLASSSGRFTPSK